MRLRDRFNAWIQARMDAVLLPLVERCMAAQLAQGVELLTEDYQRIGKEVAASPEFLRKLRDQVVEDLNGDEFAERVAGQVDISDIAYHIDTDDVAKSVEVDTRDLASGFDVSEIASEIELADLAGEIDYKRLAMELISLAAKGVA